MNLEEIFNGQNAGDIITQLKKKKVLVPSWDKIRRSYIPSLHKIVRDRKGRADKVLENGEVEKAARIYIGLEKLLVERMAGFMFSIPVKRVYDEPNNDMSQEEREERKKIINAIEKVYKQARINSENLARAKGLYASCEFFTLWYTRKSPNNKYGFHSEFKFKCKTYTPMDGTKLYPLFDDQDDMIAMSLEYKQIDGTEKVTFFETWTADRHYKWRAGNEGWVEVSNEDTSKFGKIAGVYMYRPEQLYTDDLDNLRENYEYKLSENSDILSYNSAPIIKAIGVVSGAEKKGETQRIITCQQGGDVGYVSWSQSIESLKYHVESIMDLYFTLAQLPNISSSKMMQMSNVSYESRQMLFADAHLKVGLESGPWMETFEREFSLVKQFIGQANHIWSDKIDDIDCEHQITPFIPDDVKLRIETLMRANGDKPLMSQKTSMQHLDMVDDVDKELAQIRLEDESRQETTDKNPFSMFSAN